MPLSDGAGGLVTSTTRLGRGPVAQLPCSTCHTAACHTFRAPKPEKPLEEADGTSRSSETPPGHGCPQARAAPGRQSTSADFPLATTHLDGRLQGQQRWRGGTASPAGVTCASAAHGAWPRTEGSQAHGSTWVHRGWGLRLNESHSATCLGDHRPHHGAARSATERVHPGHHSPRQRVSRKEDGAAEVTVDEESCEGCCPTRASPRGRCLPGGPKTWTAHLSHRRPALLARACSASRAHQAPGRPDPLAPAATHILVFSLSP